MNLVIYMPRNLLGAVIHLLDVKVLKAVPILVQKFSFCDGFDTVFFKLQK